MSNKIYIGNLPWALNDDELKEAFTEHGNVVSANIVTDKHTGRSRGFGFVEMENEDEAKGAVEVMNGTDLKGRKIVVASARASK
ncbi:MAG: RNA-binding protein [Ignavibacteriaceae bacterium]|nr:RNA-binding protein [Ignavibacteriaceae bacterium]